jgi:membrane-associated HD superfamily phosphohydrolase
MASAGGATSV